MTETKSIFINKWLTIDHIGTDKYLIVCSKFKKANAVNKLLGSPYPCAFVDGDEPLFKVTSKQLRTCWIVLGLVGSPSLPGKPPRVFPDQG